MRLTAVGCVNQWVRYQVQWIARPPRGYKAVCEARLRLIKESQGERYYSDDVGTVTAYSDDVVFPGTSNGDLPGHHLKIYQLGNVYDFEFIGGLRVYASA